MDLRLALSLAEAKARLRELEALGVGLEVYLDPALLEEEVVFQDLAQALSRPPSVHLPFWNLDLLSPDPEVRALSLRRLLFALERAAEMGADRAVFHSGIPHGRTPEEAEARAGRLVEALRPLVRRALALGVRLLLENTHEPHPMALAPVLEAYPEGVGFCFDAAHARVFSQTPEPGPWLALEPEHLHLNDTDGTYDRHWNLGRGVLDHPRWLGPYLDHPLVLEVREDPRPSLELLRGIGVGRP
ncbi:Xylose isomerase domain protein TIM barrel [Thermus sp. CCB_US3_UF1]|uniref:sugar phosphate isomerase/epimerase family protein n=1 Tax=unclassified Thermus TaxID=2619321 RepID=UPI000238A11C|nr:MULTISPECIES: sugar phosphate isomerase/epimerase family protein [unclassified Thermus]AEV16199.1 Xylose isomerase domain protein TIM barrel [Thermus sp. CCB_US3_UF1]MCS6868099.1 sugar phosphate isomerase/epimerase [Thermus sp.]MDW8357344.1 sugar phosphate isomerase/epimerase family protein [Thermus sp.]